MLNPPEINVLFILHSPNPPSLTRQRVFLCFKFRNKLAIDKIINLCYNVLGKMKKGSDQNAERRGGLK